MAKPLISEELAEFIECGLAIVVGTRDADLQPAAVGAWAVRVEDGGSGLTVYLHEDAGREMLRNLVSCPEIALDMDLPSTHRACQIKGVFRSSRAVVDSERDWIERQTEAFVADLESYGVPRSLSSGWQLWPCVALELRVTQVFEQTPGPGAGEPFA